MRIISAWHDGEVDQAAVDLAAGALRGGGVVGLPTETVYGLAALADDPAAVDRVFMIKDRPRNHPVIVHVADTDLSEWGTPGYAQVLAEAFWPGPLTVLIHAHTRLGTWITGGHPTVAVRSPAHPVAQALIQAAGPVIAPSANRFGHVSPTSAADVARDLGDRMGLTDLILDGGDCPVGVESTIVDCTGDLPQIVRWGAVEPDDIAGVVGRAVSTAASTAAAPGTLTSHYAPRARVHIGVAQQPGSHQLALLDVAVPDGVIRLASPTTTAEFAAVLYRALRDADDLGSEDVWVQPPDDGSALARAVADRLRRASAR